MVFGSLSLEVLIVYAFLDQFPRSLYMHVHAIKCFLLASGSLLGSCTLKNLCHEETMHANPELVSAGN